MKCRELQDNDIGDCIPAELGNLNSLQVLYVLFIVYFTFHNKYTVRYLDNNKLEGDIPSSLLSLPNLTEV